MFGVVKASVDACVREGTEWHNVHEGLRKNARARAELDIDEARWLRRALELQLWKRFGCATVYEYLERELGYGPRDARDRLRVARALGELSGLEAALADGSVKYSGIRELTRVATRATEAQWLAAARGKNLRQIEELVAGRRRGDTPETPPNPDVCPQRISFDDVSPETRALLRQARTALAEEHGENLDDDQLLATLCRRALAPEPEGTGGPSHQIAVTVCEHCKRAWQLGGGRAIEVSAAALERATCDANHVGSLDAEQPERAKADVPPATRRLVMQRDRGRCTVPGCRSARGLDLHHITPRAHGGDHAPSNLTVTCFFHHQQTHAGLLEISGSAPDQLVFERRPRPFEREPNAAPAEEPSAGGEPTWVESVVEASATTAAERDRKQAIEARVRETLVNLGFKPTQARDAVLEARTHVGPDDVSVETVLRAALAHCPRSRSA